MNPIVQRNITQCINAEASVIGAAILRGGEVVDEVNLPPDAFYDPRHREVWTAIVALHARGERFDPVTIEAELIRVGKIQAVGGLSFLSEFVDFVPTADNAEFYAAIVRRSRLSRQIVSTLSELLVCHEDGDDLLQYSLMRLAELQQESPLEAQNMANLVRSTYSDILQRAQNPAWGPKRIPSGFRSVDAIIGGFPIGVISVVAAPQSIGKSSFMRDCIMNPVKAGRGPGLLISLEDTANIVAERVLAGESFVANWRINHMPLTRDEIDSVGAAAERIHRIGKDFYVVDSIRSSAEYCLMIRKMKRKTGLTMVVVDYLQNVDEPEARGDDYRAINISLSNFTRLAKDENLAVVLVSQLKRRVKGERVDAGDMRGSGKIEEKARLLIALEREPDSSDAKLTVLKNSHGRKGEVDLYFDGDAVSYRDVAR